MPVATVRLPDGRTAQLNVPDDATPAQIRAAAERIPPAEQPTEQREEVGGISPDIIAAFPALGQIPAVAEFAAATGRSLADMLDFFGPGAANAILRLSGSETQVPTLSGAIEGTSFEGGFMAPGTGRDVVQAAGAVIPAAAAGLTAVPRAAGTLGSAALDILGVGATKAAAPVATAARAVTEAVVPGRAAAAKAAELPLLRESGDVAAAGFKLDPKGKVIPDRVQRAAIKQGFQEGFVAQVKAAPAKAKEQFKKMVDVAEKGKANFRFAASNNTLDVVGGSLLNRIKIIRSANQAAGKRISPVVKSMGNRNVDASEAVSNFTENLDAMSVQFDPGTGNISFVGSDLEDQPGPQRIVKSVIKRMLRPGANKAQEVHRIKRFIDSIVTFGKQEGGLGGNAERVLKQLRGDLNSALGAKFPEYKRVNAQYSETIDALDEIQRLAGKKTDLLAPNADQALGVLSRRVLSNAQSGPQLNNSIEELDNLARKYVTSGGTDVVPFREVAKRSGVTLDDLDDDIVGQVMFSDELEQIFDITKRKGLAGEVKKGTQQAARVSRGTVEAAAEVAGSVLEKARGINDENAFKAIRDLLAD